jgi:hypothetical protein
MTKKKNKEAKDHPEENFFEVLAASSQDYSYQSEPDSLKTNITEDAIQEARTTAIITILLVVVAAMLVGILMLRGLEALKNAAPVNQTTYAGTPK